MISRLADSGIVTSVFIDADLAQIEAAARIGASVCEIHTGPYAHAFHARGRDAEAPAVLAELDKVRQAGKAVRDLGMRFNAGHALNYYNVQPIAALSGIRELHIGHAIVSRALFVGLREAVREMKRLMTAAAGAVPAASAGSSLGGAPPDGSPPDGSPLDGSPPGGSAASSSGPAPRAQGSRG